MESKILSVFHFLTLLVTAFSVNIEEAFRKEGLIPRVINSAPDKIVNVTFPSGKNPSLGNKLDPSDIESRPMNLKYDGDSTSNYTIMMIDADPQQILNQDVFGPYLLLMIYNVIGNNIDSGLTAFPYVKPNPSLLSNNRYVFLVFVQPFEYPDDFIETSKDPKLKKFFIDRIYFNAKSFAEKYHLILDSGNFFTSGILE